MRQQQDEPSQSVRTLAMGARRDFRLYFGARAVSVVGSAVTGVVLPIMVYQLSRSPVLTGAFAAVNGLVYACFGLYAGVLADRANRKRMLIYSDMVRALTLMAIPLVFLLHSLPASVGVAVVFVVAVVNAVFFATFDAANHGVLRTIVGPERFGSATGTLTVVTNAAEVVIPAGTGLLLILVQPSTLVVVDAVSFAVAAVLLVQIKTRFARTETPQESTRRAVFGGLRFVWRDTVMRAITLAGVGQAVAEGMVIGQLVVFADLALSTPDAGVLGILYAALGAGGVAAGFLLHPLTRRLGTPMLSRLCLTASTVLLLGLSITTSWILATLLLFLWAAAYLLVFVGGISYRQSHAPDELQGRVSVVGRLATLGLGVPVGSFLGGIVTSLVGTRWNVAIAAAVTGATILCLRNVGRGAASPAAAGRGD